MKQRDYLLYWRDLDRRHPKIGGPMEVRIAQHLVTESRMNAITPLLGALQSGSDLAPHISPMKSAKTAFKRALSTGTWTAYVRLMDTMLNKWGIHHFHAAGSSLLVFVHLDYYTSVARIIDLIPHNGDWKVEKRLIGIVVENWPTAGIVEAVEQGQSELTETDLLDARRQGLNAPVEVGNTFYMPHQRALMTDGSSYDFTDNMPVVIVAKRINPLQPAEGIRSPQVMMVGVDPGNPMPSWEVAAAEAGRLSAKRHSARQKKFEACREHLMMECVQNVLRRRK